MSSKDYFEQVASSWDSMRQQFFSERVREKAFAAAGVRGGTLAADLGAGTGFITEGLVKLGVRVIAVDQSESMLAELERKFPEQQGVICRVGRADRLPIQDCEVEHAFANMYLHHVEHPAEAVREMVRILKQGGKLVITDLDEHNFEFLRTEQYDRWMGFRREDVAAWFASAGLTNIAVDCAGETCSAASECGSEQANVSIFLAVGEKV